MSTTAEHPAAPEQRTVDVDVRDLDTRGRTLHGYAAVYGVESGDLGGFRERIAPGAFADVMDADVRCLLNHSPNEVLGRTRSGTLRLADDERGLRFECDLPSSPLGENVRSAVGRGDVDGASFRFRVGRESWEGDLRTVETVAELQDVTVATYGAYPAASVELRTRPDPDPDDDALPAAARTETNAMETETEERTGLAVEDRTVEPEGGTIEQRVADAMRAVPRGENRALTTAADIAPPELSTFLFDRLRPGSAVLRSGIRVITTDRESITWPRLTADVDPTWVAETVQIPAGDPTFASLTATPRKLAHRVELSNEVIDDSDPSVVDVLNGHLATILGLKLDRALVEGTGTAPEIRGLRNVAGIQSVSLGTNGAALTSLDAFADAIALLEAANVPGPYVAVMGPRTWATIRKFKDSTGSPILTEFPTADAPQRIFGVPVYVTSQLPVNDTQGTATNASSAYVYAPSEVILVRRQDAEIELDRSRLFDRDMSELRAKLRADLIVPNPSAVVRITGITP